MNTIPTLFSYKDYYKNDAHITKHNATAAVCFQQIVDLNDCFDFVRKISNFDVKLHRIHCDFVCNRFEICRNILDVDVSR